MTKKLLFTTVDIAFFIVSFAFGQVNDPFIRFPSLSPDGTEVAFEYDGDIWKASTTGGLALRLTVHEGYDTRPKWSPDGKQIAFSGMRYGNYDIFVMGMDGGFPERITYHSANDNLSGWTATNELLFTSRRTFVQIEPEEEILLVSRDGGTPKRINDAPGFTPEYSPNGRFLAFVTGSCPYEREEYRGSANRNIWLYDTQAKNYLRLTSFDGNDYMPHWTSNTTLYYISSKKGRNNIFRMNLDNEGKVVSEEQVTFFKDDGARYFSVSHNGKKLALERQASVYIMDIPDGKPYKLEVSISSDYHFDPIEY